MLKEKTYKLIIFFQIYLNNTYPSCDLYLKIINEFFIQVLKYPLIKREYLVPTFIF